MAKMEDQEPKEPITSTAFPTTPPPTAAGAPSSVPNPQHTSVITQAELDQAMDLWNDDEVTEQLDYLDSQYTHLREDWLTFARHLLTIPSKLMGTYFQKDLQIPRDWVWPHNKAKTMEHYYTTLMALHLWDENMQFPPLTHKEQTYPIPKFWQPPPAEEPETDLSNQGQILSEQSRANSLPLFTAQQQTGNTTRLYPSCVVMACK